VGTPGRRRRGESGQGLLPTLFGFAVVLVLLLFTVQVVFDLYARSVVTAAAVDAVRSVTAFSNSRGYAPSSSTPDAAEAGAEARAVDRARASLGGYARATTFTWLPAAPGEVALQVEFRLSGTPLRFVDLPLLNTFSRTIRGRIEQIVCPAGQGCSIITAGGPASSPAGAGVGGS